MTDGQDGWFADLADEEDRVAAYPWQPFLQTEGGCFPLPVWFKTQEDCQKFIALEVIGARALP